MPPPPARARSSPGLPPYQPRRSDDKFAAVVPPVEILDAVFWPEDFDHPSAKVQIRALQNVAVDQENRLRKIEAPDYLEAKIVEALEEQERTHIVTWATRFLRLGKWILVLAIGATIPTIVKYWIEPKSAPALKYDKDGIPIPR